MHHPIVLAFALSGAVALMAQSPTTITAGSVVYIEDSEFGHALSAALIKKKVPLNVTTNRENASFFVEESSKAEREGTGERVAKVLVLGAFAGGGKSFEASVQLTNADGMVVFAHNVRKSNARSAAEEVAKKLGEHIRKRQG
jgi:hypothetical protein